MHEYLKINKVIQNYWKEFNQKL